MEPPTLVKTFKYSSSQQPMFGVLDYPLQYRSSSAHINPTKFEDITFSSYLKSKDPLQKPKENVASAIDDTEISIFDAQKYFSEQSDRNDMRTQQQELPNDLHSAPRLSSVSSADGYGRNFRTRSFHATPTASSEASWNSQTGLLANPPGSVGVSLRNFSSDDGRRRSSIARKWIFGRKCCCTGKKSVQVKEAITSDSEHGGPVITSENNNNGKANYLYAKRDSYKAKASSSVSQRSSITSDILEIHQHKVMAPNSLRMSPENEFPAADPPRQQRISASGRTFADGPGGFSFPILSASAQAAKPGLKAIITKAIINPLEDPPRDSLEVFQPMHDNPSVSRPPSMDNSANSRPHFNPGSPIARVVNNTDDDNGSDASSDLFEIESFSTQTTSYPTYRRRDSLDEAPTFNARRFASANGLTLNNNSNIQYGRRSLDEPPTPSVAATECYAPSEVSIDWSVTTAEGYDRASISNFSVSASDIGTAAFLRQRLQEESVGGDSGRRKGNGGGGLLLMSCRQEKAVSVGPQPVKCAPAEGPPIFPVHVGGRPPRANKPPLASDHSARLSLAFAA